MIGGSRRLRGVLGLVKLLDKGFGFFLKLFKKKLIVIRKNVSENVRLRGYFRPSFVGKKIFSFTKINHNVKRDSKKFYNNLYRLGF